MWRGLCPAQELCGDPGCGLFPISAPVMRLFSLCSVTGVTGTQGPQAVTYLDGLDQVGSAVGDLLGRLDKMPLGHGVGCLGGGYAAGITQGRGVLGYDRGCRQNLQSRSQVGACCISAQRSLDSSSAHVPQAWAPQGSLGRTETE